MNGYFDEEQSSNSAQLETLHQINVEGKQLEYMYSLIMCHWIFPIRTRGRRDNLTRHPEWEQLTTKREEKKRRIGQANSEKREIQYISVSDLAFIRRPTMSNVFFYLPPPFVIC